MEIDEYDRLYLFLISIFFVVGITLEFFIGETNILLYLFNPMSVIGWIFLGFYILGCIARWRSTKNG